MDASAVLGMAFGSAGATNVLMCVVTSRKSRWCARNSLSCSSRAVAGDLPDGSLCRTTSKTFTFIAPTRVRASTCLVAERQILCDAIHVGGPDERGLSQRAAAFGTFALKQMPPARTPAQHFAGAGYFETFGH